MEVGWLSIFKEKFSLGVARVYNQSLHANLNPEYSSHYAINFCYQILLTLLKNVSTTWTLSKGKTSILSVLCQAIV